MPVDEQLVAFTRDRAAELTGLSNRQLDYWRTTRLMEPSTSHAVSDYRSVRLYDFADMLELATIAQLLESEVPTRRVRKIVDRMRKRGVARPLSEIRYGVAERSLKKSGKPGQLLVVLVLEDGTLEGDDTPGQMVLQGSVDVTEIRAKLISSTERGGDDVGRVEKRRGALGSKEVFAGTRIPVATVKSYLREGVPEHEILEAFPALRSEDVEAVRSAS